MSDDKKKKHLKLVKNDGIPKTEENKVDEFEEFSDEDLEYYDYEDYIQEEEDYYYNLIKPKNNLWGIIKHDGGFAVEPIYDKIEPWIHGPVVDINTFYEPKELPLRFILYKDGKLGIASDKKVLVEPTYDWIENYDYHINGLRAGYFPATKDKRTYYLDNDGNVFAEFDYGHPFFPVFSDLTFGYNKGGMFYVVNLKSKKVIFENTYINVNSADADISPNRIMLKLNKGNKYVVLDGEGNVVNELKNNEMLEDYKIRYLSDKVLMYSKENKELGCACGLINYEGKILTDIKYRNIEALLKFNKDNQCEYSDYLLCSPLVPQVMEGEGLPKLMGSLYFDILNYKGEVVKSNLKNAMDMPAPNIYENAGCLPIYYYDENDEEIEQNL